MNQLFGNMHGMATGKDEWLTPPQLIKALGEFDLDPCAPINPPWQTAKSSFTVEHDGLMQSWQGRVWMNPPYGNKTSQWMERLARHGDGIALIFARTETRTFFPWVWEWADSVFFFDRRITFIHVDGTPARNSGGAPSCLVAYGAGNTASIRVAQQRHLISGKLLPLKSLIL